MSEQYIIGVDLASGPDVTIVHYYENGELIWAKPFSELTEEEKKIVERQGYHG